MAKKQKNLALTLHAQSEKANFYQADSFGVLFRNLRKDAGLSLDRLAELTKINKQYLLYLENEQFEKLPSSVYVRGFIRKCGKLFIRAAGDAEVAGLMRFYSDQLGQIRNRAAQEVKTRNTPSSLPIIGPQGLAIFAVAIFLITVFSFLLIKFTPFLFKPRLDILKPTSENTIINFSKIMVEGKTRFTSSLTLNGEKLYIGKNGNFFYELEMAEGINRLVFEATGIFGRKEEVVKRVVYITGTP